MGGIENHMKPKPYLPFLFILIAGLLIVTLAHPLPGSAQQNPNQLFLPLIQNGVSLPPADQAAQRITVPAGFAIRIYAQNLSAPRLMAVGPDGWLYVALYGAGQIARLPDRNHDGLADSTEIVASGLTSPHNLEWHNGWMYVAELGKIERLADQNNDGIYETSELVTNNIPGGSGHSSRTLHFGPDGKLYVSAGSSCNLCVETDPRRAAILRFNADGSIPSDNPFANASDPQKRPVWAWGLRNSVDFLWTANGDMYADHNGVDGLGDNTPPEEVLIPIRGNQWYGWPYCYTPVLGINKPTQPEIHDTRLPLPAGLNCTQAVPALFTAPAHSAPLGMTTAAQAAFPAAYQDDLFVAYHGSWNTNDPANYRDCKVERILFQNGQVTGSETFASGWRAPGKLCGDAATWGRPAGVTFGADGAMYISDDKGGRVYRVVYTGQ